MLKDGAILVVVLLLVAGALLWWTQTPTHYGGPVQDVQAQQAVPASQPAPVAKAKPLPKAEIVVQEIAGTAPAAPAAASPVVAAAAPAAVVAGAPTVMVTGAAPAVHRDPPPFPAVGQIPRGVHEDTITGKYGDPQLSAVTSTGGHVVETMVYAREGGRLATVIRIEDGKVSSAYSQKEPVVPPGMSAPRRWHNE